MEGGGKSSRMLIAVTSFGYAAEMLPSFPSLHSLQSILLDAIVFS